MSEHLFLRTGTVLTADRNPVSGAFVTIKDASVRVPEIAIVTDFDGQFKIRLPAGRFTLRTYVGEQVTDTQITIPNDSTIETIIPNR